MNGVVGSSSRPVHGIIRGTEWGRGRDEIIGYSLAFLLLFLSFSFVNE